MKVMMAMTATTMMMIRLNLHACTWRVPVLYVNCWTHWDLIWLSP